MEDKKENATPLEVNPKTIEVKKAEIILKGKA
jgi:hypothetical protein